MKKVNKNLVIWILIIILVGFLAVWSIKNSSNIGPLGSIHEHADFKVYINGEVLNLSQQKYMLRDKYVHVENMDGAVIHKHATGVTIGYFLKTLGFEFNKECFKLDTGEEYCTDKGELKMYVNGEENNEFENYIMRDKDKILIEYILKEK